MGVDRQVRTCWDFFKNNNPVFVFLIFVLNFCTLDGVPVVGHQPATIKNK